MKSRKNFGKIAETVGLIGMTKTKRRKRNWNAGLTKAQHHQTRAHRAPSFFISGWRISRDQNAIVAGR
jgi:hypothetical protein